MMDDASIVALYWQRSEAALQHTRTSTAATATPSRWVFWTASRMPRSA